MSTVVQVSFHRDRRGRQPDALLDAWPTLEGCATAAHRAGVDIAVVQAHSMDAEVVRGGVSFHFVREPAGFQRGTPQTRPVRGTPERIASVVLSLTPRLLHVHGLSLCSPAVWLKRRSGARLLVQDHADRPPRPWRRPGARAALGNLDAVAFTAREQARPFFTAGLFEPDLPVHEVTEASSGFSPGSVDEAKERSGIYGDPCAIWLGRLDRNKDPLTVLDGFAAAVPVLPDPHLWMCYRDGNLERAVRQRTARDASLRDRVHMLGARDHADVEVLLRAADILVQGSHHEGSGYAVLEAMACGTIPVVTRIPPFRRMAGLAGVFWNVGDAADLAAQLASLGTGNDRLHMRRRARSRFLKALSWDAIGGELAKAYHAVLTAPPRTHSNTSRRS